MGQISFKISDADKEFLEWVSQKTAQPVSSIYRNVTLESIQDWKINFLLKEYQSGSLSIKKLLQLANLNFNQITMLFQKYNIEPPVSELIDNYTSKLAEEIDPATIFKDGKVPKRKSSEII